MGYSSYPITKAVVIEGEEFSIGMEFGSFVIDEMEAFIHEDRGGEFVVLFSKGVAVGSSRRGQMERVFNGEF